MKNIHEINPARFFITVRHGFMDFRAVGCQIDEKADTAVLTEAGNLSPIETRGTADNYVQHLRQETKDAREMFLRKWVYKRTFAAQDAGNCSEAYKAFIIEHAAITNQTAHGPIQDVDALLKARRAFVKAFPPSQPYVANYLLLALWDGLLSHLPSNQDRADEINRLMKWTSGDRWSDNSLRKAVTRNKLPTGPGNFKFSLQVKPKAKA